jgi:hypothetical protein
MVKVKLYIEGGGGDSQLQDTKFRSAWRVFFEKAGLRELRKMPAVFRGGGRTQTYDAFFTAARVRKPDELPLLLVDSEDTPEEGHTVWQHLTACDGWKVPEGSSNDDAFLMVCCMETWLVADREALKRFFPEWIDGHLPKWPNLEKVEKQSVFNALKGATAKCKKPYTKGDVSFDALQIVDPATVENACPAAKRLLDRLRKL